MSVTSCCIFGEYFFEEMSEGGGGIASELAVSVEVLYVEVCARTKQCLEHETAFFFSKILGK